MSYDRYIAICKPLRYGSLLGSRACAQMAAAAWGSGVLCALLHTANTFSLPLCGGNAVDQFFCEVPQILKLSCSDSYLREMGLLTFSVFVLFGGCFAFILLPYVQILRICCSYSYLRNVWVLMIGFSLASTCFIFILFSYVHGKQKAFSTCLPHLFVVSLFFSTAIFTYLKPPYISSPSLDLVVTVLYSVVPPAINPLICSMRNKELKDALQKLMSGCTSEVMSCLSSPE
ncbi:olfactory receptor 14C36-like [Anas acuta]|uniref:olfactory receptor 14C36-like n=1 Tax=Anas acuta TaxID=28680 RepID=UPI0035C9353E